MKNGYIFCLTKIYDDNKKQPRKYGVVFYKSEKSAGKLSSESGVGVVVEEDDPPNILFQISSIFSKIRVGFAYLSTSSPRSLPSTGKRNIVRTVTTTQITA